MSLRSIWKERALAKVAAELRHVRLIEWRVEREVDNEMCVVAWSEKDSAIRYRWCEMFTRTMEEGAKHNAYDMLKVTRFEPGNVSCTMCDALMFNWLKERGL